MPLPEINDASAYDKMPGIGPHPKGIHHWWARLPLPTARAVLFASVVDDPSEHPERFPTEEAQNTERERLFNIIHSMMGKKLHEQPEVYAAAHAEMLKHCDGKLPAVYDPFAGGGSIPLEANRLGFESHAADLNPVAVLLNKCNLELAPRWTDSPPVNPEDRKRIGGSDSCARHARTRSRCAVLRIARSRPGTETDWASLSEGTPAERVRPNRGQRDRVDLGTDRCQSRPCRTGQTRSAYQHFCALHQRGAQGWLEPQVDKMAGTYRLVVRNGAPNDRTAHSVREPRAARVAFAVSSRTAPIPFSYIRTEGQAGRLGSIMLAVIAEVRRGRIYLDPTPEQIMAAQQASPRNYPETALPDQALGFRVQNYGITQHWQMFTPRQLEAMVTLSDLVRQVAKDVECDALGALGTTKKANEYAATITVFLGLALDRCASFNNSLCRWNGNQTVFLFTRQAISMLWDFSEANIMGDAHRLLAHSGGYLRRCGPDDYASSIAQGCARQIDAASGANGTEGLLVSTDPPYYDNIGYAALSDVFYIWLRRTLSDLYPELFSTVLVPKLRELTAAPELFDGDKDKAKSHFESGFRKTFTALKDKLSASFPLTVYYAFKQDDEASGADEEEDRIAGVDLTTGWETLLEALNSSGFQITATWPVRALFKWRMRALGSNALASYIVLACRPRPSTAPLATRKDVINSLRTDLPRLLRNLQYGNIAPVDLAQAAIGPGMAVFTKYAKVIESDGTSMSIRTALGIINQVLDEVLTEQEGDFDPDTRWALAWFAQFGMAEEAFGLAETLSKAKNTAINGLVKAGIVKAKSNKVQLVSRAELSNDWNPATDKRLTVWETTQHLIRTLETKGEAETATLLNRLGGIGETARDLAYRLFSICERKKWADEALAYNSLVIAWPELSKLALSSRNRQPEKQQDLF